jgi:penicillin-binding protein-related factor A (putative recombinase)
MPFFSFQKSMLCYFWIDKKSNLPYIGFMEGKDLDFEWLEAGDRSRVRIMYIDPYEDLPLKKIRQTLKASIIILLQKSPQRSQ